MWSQQSGDSGTLILHEEAPSLSGDTFREGPDASLDTFRELAGTAEPSGNRGGHTTPGRAAIVEPTDYEAALAAAAWEAGG